MKKNTSILLVIGIALLLLVVGLYIFVIRPRLTPIRIEPIPDIGKEVPELPESRNAVLNLYFHAPLPLSGIARMELTLTGIEAIDEGGASYSVFEGSRRITIQESIVQKIASEKIFHGETSRFILTFGPTAQITSTDRSRQTVFLPNRELAITVSEEIPQSRTLNALIALPKNTAFGEKNGVLTLELPVSTEVDYALLGGIFLNERSIGEVFSISKATIRDAILADIGLDITPRAGERGSSGFGPAEEAAPDTTK